MQYISRYNYRYNAVYNFQQKIWLSYSPNFKIIYVNKLSFAKASLECLVVRLYFYRRLNHIILCYAIYEWTLINFMASCRILMMQTELCLLHQLFNNNQQL